MAMTDWIHKYPQVQALLHGDDDVLAYAPDGEDGTSWVESTPLDLTRSGYPPVLRCNGWGIVPLPAPPLAPVRWDVACPDMLAQLLAACRAPDGADVTSVAEE